MNEIGISLIWLAIQVTVLCAVVLAVSGVLGRKLRQTSLPTTVALLLVIVLSAGLFSPWPRWDFRSARVDSSISQTTASPIAQPVDNSEPSSLSTGSPDTSLESPILSGTLGFWDGLKMELGSRAAAEVNRGDSWNWIGWLAAGMIGVCGLGLVRLTAGWWSVRKCVRRSRPITESNVLVTLNELQSAMNCCAPVQMRESKDLSSAATVGWRSPIILLPAGWRSWSDNECRMVLAHELAHIASGDSVGWLIAQLGLLLHFYHPLVHWLVRRLRLEQELAADAAAARVTGGW